MAEDQDVTTWQKRLEAVEAGLAKLLRSDPSDDLKDDPEPEAKKKPEPVQPPKKDAKPPEEPTKEEPAPVKAQSPLHKLIFG